MADQLNSLSITGIAGALAQAIGAEAPRQAEPANRQLLQLVRDHTANGRVDRLFLYNPDAVALWLYQKYTDLFDPVVRYTRLALPLRTVMPSVTPVCFGSLYTGAFPAVHGIMKYEKPVIRIDTLFDSLLRAGKKVAIIADSKCSMSHIFLERELDYFLFDDIDGINAKAEELIDQDQHDVLVVYNGNYDATMHHTGPESEDSLAALASNAKAFEKFAQKIQAQWMGHDTLLAFAMDHGCHEIDGGCGSHGLDMVEDLNIMHFYGLMPRR